MRRRPSPKISPIKPQKGYAVCMPMPFACKTNVAKKEGTGRTASYVNHFVACFQVFYASYNICLLYCQKGRTQEAKSSTKQLMKRQRQNQCCTTTAIVVSFSSSISRLPPFVYQIRGRIAGTPPVPATVRAFIIFIVRRV